MSRNSSTLFSLCQQAIEITLAVSRAMPKPGIVLDCKREMQTGSEDIPEETHDLDNYTLQKKKKRSLYLREQAQRTGRRSKIIGEKLP